MSVPKEISIPSRAYRRFALSVLMVINALNILDRQIVTTLAEAIKTDLHLSDAQLGVTTGLGFGVLYSLLGLPIARIAERRNRPYIISIAVVVWSAFTVVGGFAQTFVQFLLSRVGVGVGEAGCTPPAHSLISDYTPREERASALAFFHLGLPIGSLLGVVVGGVVGGYLGWRAAFFFAGLPGIIAALVVVVLREPRRALGGEPVGAVPSLREVLAELKAKRTFQALLASTVLLGFRTYGIAAFTVPFYMRVHGAEIVKLATKAHLPPLSYLALVIGLVGSTAGIIGTWVGGALTDRLARNDARAPMTVPAVAGLIAIPAHLLGLFTPGFWPTVAVMVVPTMLGTIWIGPIMSTVQGLARPPMRATASAITNLAINLLGLGLGPLFVGIVSDALKRHGWSAADGIRWSLATISVLGSLYIPILFRARKSIAFDLGG